MNEELRNRIKAAGLRQWQIATAIGVSEWTFTRWMRVELSEERKRIVLDAIAQLSRKEKNA